MRKKSKKKERAVPEQRNKKILDQVKEVTYQDLKTILKKLDENDHELVKGSFATEEVAKYFFDDCKCGELKAIVTEILNK